MRKIVFKFFLFFIIHFFIFSLFSNEEIIKFAPFGKVRIFIPDDSIITNVAFFYQAMAAGMINLKGRLMV